MGIGARMDPSPCSGYPAEIVMLAVTGSKYLSVRRNERLEEDIPKQGEGIRVLRHKDWSRGSTYSPRSECEARGRKLFRIPQRVIGKPVVSVGCDQQSGS